MSPCDRRACLYRASSRTTPESVRTFTPSAAHGGDTIGRQAARPLELIEIRPRDDEARRPRHALLILHVLIRDPHLFGRIVAVRVFLA